VQLDPGLSGTIDETLAGNQLPPGTATEEQVGRQVARALAEKLVVEIRDMGLPAERGIGLPPGVGTGVIVTGQFVSIDQGNRTERVMIGLGAGRSDVRVLAQVFDVAAGRRTLADEIEVDAPPEDGRGHAAHRPTREARDEDRTRSVQARRHHGRDLVNAIEHLIPD
jgi:hypothetical protein